MQLILHIFYQMMLYHFNYIPLAQQSINVSSHTYRSILLNEVPKPYDLVVPNDSFPTDIHDEDANYNHLIAGSIVKDNVSYPILFGDPNLEALMFPDYTCSPNYFDTVIKEVTCVVKGCYTYVFNSECRN